MKAVVYEKYGGPEVLHLTEVEKPVPADDEILIKVHAVSLNGSDREALVGRPLYTRIGGLSKPANRILGSDIAGHVEAVGKNNEDFKPDDEVFGEMPGYHGGLAEYVCTRGSTMALKPSALTFEQAAAIPQAGVIAWRGIRSKGRVKPGQRVLINGAGGSAGSFLIQLARLSGAEVTGVDHAGKLDFIRSLGADHVVDYTKDDFTKGETKHDLIIDLFAHRSLFACRRALARGGTYFFVGGSVGVIFQTLLLGPGMRRIGDKDLRVLIVPQNRDDLVSITELCEAGSITPVIDRRYPLSEVKEAFGHLVGGDAKGKVVVSMDPS